MLQCPYCKQKIEKSWRYCHYCNKPLITDIELDIGKNFQHSYAPSFSTKTAYNELFSNQVVYDEEIERKLQEVEEELIIKEAKGETTGDLLLEKASLHFKRRDLDLALKNLEYALKNFQQDENQLKIAICHNEIGLIYEEKGFFDQAIFHFDEAFSILDDLKEYKKKVQVLNNLGNLYYLIKDWQESYNKYQKAIEISEELHLEYEIVKSSSNLVEILFKFKDYGRIEKILSSNLIFFEEKQDFYGIIQTRIKFGKLYYNFGKDYYDQSYHNFNEAIELINLVKDQMSLYVKARLEWECYLYLGKLNLLWDNDYESEVYFLKSLEAVRTFEITDHIKEGIVLENMAKMYLLQGEDKKAIEYYNFAVEIYEKYGDRKKIAEILSSVGEIYIDYLQDSDNALVVYNESLKIFEELEQEAAAAKILVKLSDVYLAKKEKVNALESLEQAKIYYQELDLYSELDLVLEKLRKLEK